jgi:hypothetical protein
MLSTVSSFYGKNMYTAMWVKCAGFLLSGEIH